MKKIMFVLAFASMALFANASDGKLQKINFSKEVTLEKSSSIGIWNVTIVCGGSGATYRFVGFNTQAEALAYGHAFADVFC